MRGLPSPFIRIYKRERETPHPSLLPLVPVPVPVLRLRRKDFLDEILVAHHGLHSLISPRPLGRGALTTAMSIP